MLLRVGFRTKSQFLKNPIGRGGHKATPIADVRVYLNCEVMKVPFTYLGMEVGDNHRRTNFWGKVIEKISKRLDRWKGKFLSMAGRICMLKSIFSLILLFYMSFYKIPKLVVDTIKKIQRNFLWDWGKEGKKIAWVAWEKVCESREAGGLGIKDIRTFNETLLEKWIWRMQSEEGGLWREVLDSKYGGWRELRRAVSSYKESNWWKDLKKVWLSKEWGNCFEDEIS